MANNKFVFLFGRYCLDLNYKLLKNIFAFHFLYQSEESYKTGFALSL